MTKRQPNRALQLPRWRLGLLLWALGMPGSVAVTLGLLPTLLAGESLPLPLWALVMLSLGQGAAILALAVWVGVALAPALGLGAPVLGAMLAGRSLSPELRPRLMPALLAGLLGGVGLFIAWRYAPTALAAVSERLFLTV